MFSLKCLAVIYMLTLVVIAEVPEGVKQYWQDTVKPFHDTCVEQSKVDVKDITLMVENGIVGESLGCYLNCIHKKTNFIKPDGSMDVNFFDKIENSHLTRKLLKDCIDKISSEPDSCTKSWKLATCIAAGVVV